MKAKEILIALIAALLLAVFISPFASNFPDALEKVAEDKHFIENVRDSFLPSCFGDYAFPCFENEKIKTALAGFLGVIIVFLTAMLCAKGIKAIKEKL